MNTNTRGGAGRRSAAAVRGAVVAILLCLAAQAQGSEIIRVGPAGDPACQYSDLSQAIAAAPRDVPVQIRVVQFGGTLQPDYENIGPITLIDRDLVLSGGYASCSATSPSAGKRSRLRTVLGSSPVLRLFSAAQPVPRLVRIERFELSGGHGVDGAGIQIQGANRVELIDSLVQNNTASVYGGGVLVKGAAASLRLAGDSLVTGNGSDAYGGGVACVDGRLELAGASVSGNTAFAHGGGVFAHNCRISVEAGKSELSANRVDASADPGRDVFDAQGKASGGGLYLSGSSVLSALPADSLLILAGNSVVHRRFSPSRIDRGLGGGMLVRGSARAELRNLHLVNNSARIGAGARLRDDTRLSVAPSSGDCPLDDRYPGCASIQGNIARGFYDDSCRHYGGQGGAMALHNQAEADLARVWMQGNQAHGIAAAACGEPAGVEQAWGSGFDVAGGSSLVLRDSVVTGHSGSYEQDVLRVRDHGRLRALRSTLADNSRSVPTLRTSGGSGQAGPWIELSASILHQLLNAPVFLSGSDHDHAELRCLSVSDASAFQGIGQLQLHDVQVQDPGFVARSAWDFRLHPDSPALDRCEGPAFADHVLDLDGEPRAQLSSSRSLTPIDRGAYETPGDALVSDLQIATSWLEQPLPAPGQVLHWGQQLRSDGPAVRRLARLRIELDPALRAAALEAGGEGWACQAVAVGWDCEYGLGLEPGDESSALRFSARAPDQPALLRNQLRILPVLGELDPVPGNDLERIEHSVAMDADIDASHEVWSPAQWRRGDLAQLEVQILSHGPDLAHRPSFAFELPAQARSPLLWQSANLHGQAWQCTEPMPSGGGRQRIRCDAGSLAPDRTHDFGLAFAVPRDADGADWRVDWELLSVSDPEADGRHPNRGSLTVPLAAPSSVELAAFGPEQVSHQQVAEYRISLRNHGSTSVAPLYLHTGFLQVGQDVELGLVEGFELLPPAGYDCIPLPTLQGGGGIGCELQPALPPGVGLDLVVRARPIHPQGPRWMMELRAGTLEQVEAGVLVESRVHPGSPPPPQASLFGSGFEPPDP